MGKKIALTLQRCNCQQAMKSQRIQAESNKGGGWKGDLLQTVGCRMSCSSLKIPQHELYASVCARVCLCVSVWVCAATFCEHNLRHTTNVFWLRQPQLVASPPATPCPTLAPVAQLASRQSQTDCIHDLPLPPFEALMSCFSSRWLARLRHSLQS